MRGRRVQAHHRWTLGPWKVQDPGGQGGLLLRHRRPLPPCVSVQTPLFIGHPESEGHPNGLTNSITSLQTLSSNKVVLRSGFRHPSAGGQESALTGAMTTSVEGPSNRPGFLPRSLSPSPSGSAPRAGPVPSAGCRHRRKRGRELTAHLAASHPHSRGAPLSWARPAPDGADTAGEPGAPHARPVLRAKPTVTPRVSGQVPRASGAGPAGCTHGTLRLSWPLDRPCLRKTGRSLTFQGPVRKQSSGDDVAWLIYSLLLRRQITGPPRRGRQGQRHNLPGKTRAWPSSPRSVSLGLCPHRPSSGTCCQSPGTASVGLPLRERPGQGSTRLGPSGRPPAAPRVPGVSSPSFRFPSRNDAWRRVHPTPGGLGSAVRSGLVQDEVTVGRFPWGGGRTLVTW